ncbi:hypothetical protein NIES2119_31425 [[Phormidium ambiguum] IAM M-71]|uniref:Uncharacterized protein n=1 Tax=[Phormidium ambiguum] IAM M-71 TaxID=454136 RepID=A0A1U7I2C7_9CYAN|nr:hypothetical protein [Phormidium ambiguum]OKH30183.1 hypothetical protein NIES2119_31425 [Phormidium ambiguum IAM M-71]
MVSPTKLAKIPTELKRYGIEPTQQHIDGVVAILESDGRITFASAVKRYVQSLQGQQQQQPTGETSNGSTGDKLQDTLSSLSDLLGDRLLEGVVSKAVDRCHNRLISGDWSVNSDTEKKLQNLQKVLDVEFQIVEENFLSLPSSSTPNERLLPSSEEPNPELITQS